MKALVVGGGPVACLVAIGLRKRGFDVHVYEKTTDPRQPSSTKGYSFNLTLSHRGLCTLDPQLREKLYAQGVRMPQRVIHHLDGSLSYQPYGIREEQHLLSIPRGVLHRTLLNEAEQAGAQFFFNHDCIRADAYNASATFMTAGAIVYNIADILIGCDGANSIVRHEMTRNGCHLNISQEHLVHGYIELYMPPTVDREYVLLRALRNPSIPESGHHGLHIWPRGNFMLIAQPNVDKTYTTTLFMQISSESAEQPDFQRLRTPKQVSSFFQDYFPDVIEHLPRLTENLLAGPPSSLKTIKCSVYHHGRTVLLGDSAHTMVPFYGQGINCSFEDIQTLLKILDRQIHHTPTDSVIARTLSEYTSVRKPAGDAIIGLSLSNLSELSIKTHDKRFHARSNLEKNIYKRYPDKFTPLYCMVAFTNISYHEAVSKHIKQQTFLDSLCERFDLESEAEEIIETYAAQFDASVAHQAISDTDLDLSPAQMKELIDAATAHILKYQNRISDGTYPASYVYDSLAVDKYKQGISVAAELREDVAPQEGTDAHILLNEIFDKAMTNGTIHAHAGFMAHVPSGGLFQGAVGEFIARATNRFAGVWVSAPGLIQIETNVIRWFCSIMGYGEGAFGYLTTGGSIANLMALACAVKHSGNAPEDLRTIYTSEQGHISIVKAARTIGIAISRVKSIRTRHDYSMDTDHLFECIKRDQESGLVPSCVIATAGTTNTGAIDDLVRISNYCRSENLWLHVDACFGGFFRITQRGKIALEGIEQADSIAVDGHKSLFLPHGNSALLVRNREKLRDTFAITGAAYYPGFTKDPDLVDFCNYGPELSREVRGLTAWLPIKMHGLTTFEKCLDEKLDLAVYLAEQLSNLNGIKVVRKHAIHFPVVNFKVLCRSPGDEDLSNERLCELICSYGNVYLTTTQLPGVGTVVRTCILHNRTNRSVVDQLLADIRSALSVLTSEVSLRVNLVNSSTNFDA